jgi:hypothetical protein
MLLVTSILNHQDYVALIELIKCEEMMHLPVTHLPFPTHNFFFEETRGVQGTPTEIY